MHDRDLDMKKIFRVLALLVILALSTPVQAGESTSANAGDMQYIASMYAWLPSMRTTVETPEGDVQSQSVGIDDIFSSLDVTFMGTFEARGEKWGFLTDLVYTDLSSDAQTPSGILFTQVSTDVKMAVWSNYALYRALEKNNISLDLAAGLRVYAMDVSSTLSGGTLSSHTLIDESQNSADPLVGLRANWRIDPHWSVSAMGDIGGFGIGGSASDLTWQALGSVDYKINDNWVVRAGYRHLQVDKPIASLDAEIGLSGPIIGATYRF